MHVKFMTELNLIEALYLLLQLQVPTYIIVYAFKLVEPALWFSEKNKLRPGSV